MATAEQLTPRERILQVAQELGLSMISNFIPFSQSRNKAEKSPSLNWQITLLDGHGKVEGGRAILTTDYSAGCAHAPAYKQKHFGAATVLQDAAIKWECENGRPAHMWGNERISALPTGKPLKPDFADVLYSLVMDSDVLEHSSFEDWASSFGYEADSRKAEAIYRQCLDIALKLRNAIGEDGLHRLREACQDY